MNSEIYLVDAEAIETEYMAQFTFIPNQALRDISSDINTKAIYRKLKNNTGRHQDLLVGMVSFTNPKCYSNDNEKVIHIHALEITSEGYGHGASAIKCLFDNYEVDAIEGSSLYGAYLFWRGIGAEFTGDYIPDGNSSPSENYPFTLSRESFEKSYKVRTTGVPRGHVLSSYEVTFLLESYQNNTKYNPSSLYIQKLEASLIAYLVGYPEAYKDINYLLHRINGYRSTLGKPPVTESEMIEAIKLLTTNYFLQDLIYDYECQVVIHEQTQATRPRQTAKPRTRRATKVTTKSSTRQTTKSTKPKPSQSTKSSTGRAIGSSTGHVVKF